MKIKLLLILALFFGSYIYGQDYRSYLNENKKNENEVFLDGSILNKYNWIFLCENHGYHDNLIVTTKLFDEFASQGKPVYYIAEMDYWSADLAQQYINSGKVALLDSLFSGSGTFFQTHENREFFKNLRHIKLKYNTDINVVGIDIINKSLTNFKIVSNILDACKIENPLQDSLSFYLNNKSSYSARIKFSEKALENDQYFNQLPDKDAKLAKNLFQNILHYQKALNSNKWDNTRDSLMYLNFIAMRDIYQLPENAKLIFLFGRNHGYLKTTSTVKYLGSWLSDENKNIFSIYYFYCNSTQQIPKGFVPGFIRVFNRTDREYAYMKATSDNKLLSFSGHKKGIGKIVRSAGNSNVTFCNITHVNSPYEKSNDLIQSDLVQYYTLDYFQGVILIKNSKSTNKLNITNAP